MGSGGVAIAALPTVICLKVPFSDGLGGADLNHNSDLDHNQNSDLDLMYGKAVYRATKHHLC